MIVEVAALIAGSYIVGSIPMGLLVGRARGVDLRRCGSGNIGATNAGRVLGRRFGILVFALDAGKGAFCTGLAGTLAAVVTHGHSEYRDMIWVGAAMAAILGNMFSIFLSFRGGKGVGTSLGAVLGIYPYLTFPGLLAGLVWLVVVKISRYVSLASMAAVAVFPALFVGLSCWLGWRVREHTPLLILSIAMPVLVLLRHRDHISRLLSGTENRVGNAGRSESPN